MRRYIIFQAETGDAEGWEERKLEHTQALTDILAEYWDSSNQPIPEPGYRPLEFIRVDGLHDPKRHGHSTHYRPSDWEVVRVETYTPDIPTPASTFDEIVLCYCQYSPIDAPLKPMPERQVSLDSFGGDEEAYQRWLESEQGKQYAEMQHK
jgi:hypothetical protein